MPPLPSPGNIIRLRFFWATSATNEFGSRIFLKYSGGPPTAGDLTTLCSNASAHYGAQLAAYTGTAVSLVTIEAIDLSSNTGAEGRWTGNIEGTRSGANLPDDVCTLLNFQIGRRYRGGKPKIFLPPGVAQDMFNNVSWTAGFISAVSSAWGTFMADVLADTYSSFTLTDNVNVSFYEGFTPFQEPSGRYRNIPKQRTNPLVDLITGHSVKAEIGSQRRRRTAFIQP